MAPRPDISLDMDKVIRAAFDVLEKDGIEKLTMRRLAAELSVKPPAFYWHFRDKAELLSMMGNAIYTQAVMTAPPAGTWREWLLGFGSALHRILLTHRDSARLFAVARPKEATLTELQPRAMVEPLLALGLSERSALNCISSVICLSVGWSIFNDNPALQAMLGKMLDLDQNFEIGLHSLVSALPEKLPQPGSPEAG